MTTHLRCQHWTLATGKRCVETATVALSGSPRMLMCEAHGTLVADEYRTKLGWEYGPEPIGEQDDVAGLPLFAGGLR